MPHMANLSYLETYVMTFLLVLSLNTLLGPNMLPVTKNKVSMLNKKNKLWQW